MSKCIVDGCHRSFEPTPEEDRRAGSRGIYFCSRECWVKAHKRVPREDERWEYHIGEVGAIPVCGGQSGRSAQPSFRYAGKSPGGHKAKCKEYKHRRLHVGQPPQHTSKADGDLRSRFAAFRSGKSITEMRHEAYERARAAEQKEIDLLNRPKA